MQWFYAALTSLFKEWTCFGCTTDNLKLRFSEMCTKLLIVFYVCVKCSLWAIWSDQLRSLYSFFFFFSFYLSTCKPFSTVCFFGRQILWLHDLQQLAKEHLVLKIENLKVGILFAIFWLGGYADWALWNVPQGTAGEAQKFGYLYAVKTITTTCIQVFALLCQREIISNRRLGGPKTFSAYETHLWCKNWSLPCPNQNFSAFLFTFWWPRSFPYLPPGLWFEPP